MGDDRRTLKAEHRIDPVARQRTDPLGARPDVRRPDRSTPIRHAGEAPRRLPEQVVAEVHDVDAQDHQVLAAAPAIFLAPPAQLEDLADRPLGDHRLDPLVPRAVPGLKGHRELDVRPLARLDDRVARGEVGGQRLLAEDPEHPVLGARQDHVLVPVEPSRPDHDEPRLLALQHRPVIGVGLLDAQALCRPGSTAGSSSATATTSSFGWFNTARSRP